MPENSSDLSQNIFSGNEVATLLNISNNGYNTQAYFDNGRSTSFCASDVETPTHNGTVGTAKWWSKYIIYNKAPIQELKIAFHLSWPMVLSSFLEHFLFQFVAGWLCLLKGTEVFAAFSLSMSFCNIAGTAIILGLSTAADTLFSQSFGGKNFSEVGLVLQKAILIIIPFIVVIIAVFVNAEFVLLNVFKVEEELSPSAGLFLRIYSLSLPAEFLSLLLGKYIQCQGHVLPSAFANIVCNILNAILCYVFLFTFDWGVVGASLALTISMFSLVVTYLSVIIAMKYHKKTWPGWSFASLYNWESYTRLAIPGTLMTIIEWAGYEIGGLLVASIDTNSVSVQGVLYNIWACLSMWGVGVSYAATIRVGHLLGGGDSQLTNLSSRVIIIFASSVILALVTILLAMKNVIVLVFREDENVMEECSRLIPYVAWVAVMDCVSTVINGILTGCGRQKIGAIITFLGFYLIGLPLSVFLMFVVGMEVEGFWIGLGCGSTTQTLLLIVVLSRTDWNKEVNLAYKRVGKQFTIVRAARMGSAIALQRYSSSYQKSKSNSVVYLPTLTEDDQMSYPGNGAMTPSTCEKSLHMSSPEITAGSSVANVEDGLRLSFDSLAMSPVTRTYKYQWIKIVYYFVAFSIFFTGLYVAFILERM